MAQKSVSSLQLLDEEELTWAAAEANFAKCARGACFLVLKHAAFVLKAGRGASSSCRRGAGDQAVHAST